MKKALTIIALVLVISTSVIAGTLAMYTTSIDDLAQGSVVAKAFVMTEGGTDTFTQNVAIAPGETQDFKFSIKNYDGSIVSETAMALAIDVDVTAAQGKNLIAPLKISVEDASGNTVGSVTGSGLIEFDDEFALQAQGQEKTFTAVVTWPGDGSADIDYAGAEFGTALKVSVTGTQK